MLTAALAALVFLPLLGAVLMYFPGKRSARFRSVGTLSLAGICLALAAVLLFHPGGDVLLPGFCGFGLHFVLDGFRKVYALIICFAWVVTLLLSEEYFAHHHNLSRYYFFNLATLGATLGVFLAGDLVTAFIFFEIMSFTSFTWVAQEETPGAIRAANTYLAVAVIGGLVALMGLFLLTKTFGTTEIARLGQLAQAAGKRPVLYAAGGCILFGFGAKAGMFPLHIWLPKAHPVAPAPASALLSGVLTKSGVWGILAISCRLFYGDANWGAVILTLGTVTMVLGAVLALFCVDLKRTLACSSMSQIGFILVGVGSMCLLGEENALAARGTLLHMVNHSLFKLVLFSCAGVVYFNRHSLDLNDLRGFGRKKPLLLTAFLIGAAGIGGLPGLSGYVSKTLLHEGLVEAGAVCGGTVWPHAVEWLFLCSGGLTLAYMTKLFVVLFIDRQPENRAEIEKKRPYMRPLTAISLLAPALFIPVLGLLPNLLTDRIADLGTDFFAASPLSHAVHYFSLENLKGAAISLTIGAVVYFLIVRKLLMKNGRYLDRWPAKLDLENLLYRPLLTRWLPGVFGSLAAFFGENKLLWIFCNGLLSLGTRLARLFGENKLMRPLCTGLLTLGTLLSRLFGENRVFCPIGRGTISAAETAAELAGDNKLSAAAGKGLFHASLKGAEAAGRNQVGIPLFKLLFSTLGLLTEWLNGLFDRCISLFTGE